MSTYTSEDVQKTWTRFDSDDPNTWPGDKDIVLIAQEDPDGKAAMLGIAQAYHTADIKSMFNWKSVEKCFFQGPVRFTPTHWRPLWTIDFPPEGI